MNGRRLASALRHAGLRVLVRAMFALNQAIIRQRMLAKQSETIAVRRARRNFLMCFGVLRELSVAKRKKTILSVSRSSRQRIKWAIDKWMLSIDGKRKVIMKIKKVVGRWLHGTLHSAFAVWRDRSLLKAEMVVKAKLNVI